MICRFCLFEEQDETRPIWNLFSQIDHSPVLKHVQNLLNIQLSPHDSIPPRACQLCIEKIKYASDFLDVCRNSEKHLVSIFGGPSCMNITRSASSCTTFKFPNGSDSSETLSDSGKFLKPSRSCKSIKYRGPVGRRTDNFELKKIKNTQSKGDIRKRKGLILEKQQFNCTKCDKTFFDKLKLITHEQTHKLPCEICKKPVSQKRLGTHLVKHVNQFQKKLESVSKNKVKISCEICLKTFRTESSLNSHKNKMHLNSRKLDKIKIKLKKVSKKGKEINCNVCDQTFSNRKDLKKHQILHKTRESTDENPLCEVGTQSNAEVTSIPVDTATRIQIEES